MERHSIAILCLIRDVLDPLRCRVVFHAKWLRVYIGESIFVKDVPGQVIRRPILLHRDWIF